MVGYSIADPVEVRHDREVKRRPRVRARSGSASASSALRARPATSAAEPGSPRSTAAVMRTGPGRVGGDGERVEPPDGDREVAHRGRGEPPGPGGSAGREDVVARRHGDTDVEVGRRRGRGLGQERVGGSVSQPTPGSHASTGKNEPSRSAAPDRESRSRTAPGQRAGETARRRRSTCRARSVCASGTTSVVGSGGWSPAVDPADVTGPAARCAPSRAWSGPFGHSRKTSRSVGMSGVNAHAHASPSRRRPPGCARRAGSGAGRGRAPGTPPSGSADGRGGALAAARRCTRSARARGEREASSRPARSQVSLLVGLASAPSQLLRRDGLDDSAHGNALDAGPAADVSDLGHHLARERLAVDPALGGDAQLGAVEAPAPGPPRPPRARPPGTARAPSAISIAPIPPPAPAPGRSAVGSASASQPLLELGDLRRATRPSAARRPPPRRRGRAAGSARRAPRRARRRRARRRARRAGPRRRRCEAVPPTPITTRSAPSSIAAAISSPAPRDERAERIAADVGHAQRPAGLGDVEHGRRRRSGARSGPCTAGRAHRARRPPPLAHRGPGGAPRRCPRRRRRAAPRRRRRPAGRPASLGERGRRLVGGVGAAQLVGGDHDLHGAPNVSCGALGSILGIAQTPTSGSRRPRPWSTRARPRSCASTASRTGAS